MGVKDCCKNLATCCKDSARVVVTGVGSVLGIAWCIIAFLPGLMFCSTDSAATKCVLGPATLCIKGLDIALGNCCESMYKLFCCKKPHSTQVLQDNGDHLQNNTQIPNNIQLGIKSITNDPTENSIMGANHNNTKFYAYEHNTAFIIDTLNNPDVNELENKIIGNNVL